MREKLRTRKYQYENCGANDWSIDSIQVATIPEVSLLGEQNPNYSQHVVGVSLAVKF